MVVVVGYCGVVVVVEVVGVVEEVSYGVLFF